MDASYCVVIGDIVGSRAAPSRRRLHRALVAALERANADIGAREPLAPTVGDEFQGAYDTLGEALDACFRVRLALAPTVDVRFGVGRGGVTRLETAGRLQDGPAWWAAREAVVEVEARSTRAGTRLVRTAYRAAEPDTAQVAVQAALDCRDHIVGSLSGRSLRLLRALALDARSQAELADLEGISASAVSQRVRRDGLALVLEAQRGLARLA